MQETIVDYSLFQKLSENELNNYLNEIDLALEFHIKWLSQVNRALVCHTESSLQQIQNILSSDDHFWRWYSGVKDEGLLEMPAFLILGDIHTEMLSTGRELLSRIAEGEKICSSEYDRFISLATGLRKQIHKLKSKIKSDIELVARIMGKVFENADEGVMITDVESHILHVNQSFVRVTQYNRDEVVGKKPSILHSGTHDQGFYERMWNALNRKHRWQGEVWNRRKNNEIYPEWLTITAVHDDNGDTSHYIGIFSDVSTASEGNERLYHLAHYDSLCNLPNRMLFYDRLRQNLSRAKRGKNKFAVLFFDLDDLKKVNDKYGHSAGDEVLRQVSQRLANSLRESDTVARIGGDEFTIIIGDVDDIDAVSELTGKILRIIQQDYSVDGHILNISASIGISQYPETSDDAEMLVKQADIAMYKAKNEGKNRYTLFDPSME
jgi:diguanylate cyclase (GGDEF)-like protein/PAS domain S-box-containing protein